MNRRWFFKSIAGNAGLMAAALILPERTYFLPPRFGWRPWELGPGYIKEMSVYQWVQDRTMFRWEAVGKDFLNKEHRLFVEAKRYGEYDDPGPAFGVARQELQDRMRASGLLALPAKPLAYMRPGPVSARII